MSNIIKQAFEQLDEATFANAIEYRGAIAAILGDDYDADGIATICGGWDLNSIDATTKRATTYRQMCSFDQFVTICRDYGPIDSTNFYLHTVADFTEVIGHPNRPADFVSESGSRYWYEHDRVIRESDHWGKGIASCDWHLDGDECGRKACGFCAWEDFGHK